MTDLEEPSAKKAKISTTDDFGWSLDLPDELLDATPSTSNGPSAAAAPPSFSAGIPNGTNFSPGQPQSAHFNSNGGMTATTASSSSSSSVLEELLLSRTGQPMGHGGPPPPPQPPQQPTLNQRTIAPGAGIPNHFSTNRPGVTATSTPVNRLGSPPNVQVMNRQMQPVFTSNDQPPQSSAYPGPGGLQLVSGNGNMAQFRPQMQQEHTMMMAGAGRPPPPQMMNGQKMGGGAPANFVRFSRGPPPPQPSTSVGSMMMANGPMPGPNQQQMLPMNVMQQQQQMNPMAQMHQMRMNGAGPMNSHMAMNHQQFPQDLHPSQLQQPSSFSMGGQPPMGHQHGPPPPPMMSGGMRPRMPHPEMNGPRALADPFSPPMSIQQQQERMMGPTPGRMQYQPNPGMMPNVSLVNAPPPMDMMNPSLPNGMTMPPSIQPPSASTSLPYPSPQMLMSPPNAGPGSVQGPPSNDPLGPGGGGHSSGTPQDPEKRKLIQQQLVLLLHALKCQQRERNSEQAPCSLPHCETMKNVLLHMASCKEGRSCTVPHCASSRQILTHWKTCSRQDCPVCMPLRQMTDPSKRVNGTIGAAAANGHVNSEGPMMNETQGAGKLPPDPSHTRHMLESDFVGSVRPSLRTSQLLSQDSNDGSSASSFTPKLPAPEMATVQKEWHRQVTLDLRNHLVSKLVKAIFPSPDPAAMHDQRIRDLIQYARKVEKEMFETASDREEYYHLLAEKIYKIQKELQDKKQRRLEQQGRPSTTSAGQNGSPGGSASFLLSSLGNEANGSQSLSSLNGASALQNVNVKVEEGAGSSSSEAPGFSLANVKTEPSDMVKTEPPEPASTSEKKPPEPMPETSKAPAVKKVFTVEELSDALLPVWEKLEATDDAIPFRIPVDPKLLGIPDYFDVIKHPMDLSTIRTKLLDGTYTDPWQFCDDMWLMFENAWLYNRKASKVYKYCTKLSEMFMETIDPVMRSLGYCCGRKYTFTPLALVCYGQSMCSIPRDAIYYCYEENKSQFGVGSERYTYCKKCFEELPGDSINMSEDPNSLDNLIPKKNFKQLKNDQIEYEPFVDCVDCGRKWHKVCALHVDQIYPAGFICETCVKTRARRKPENRYTSKRLPQCKLSQHLEKRVNEYLKKKVPPETPAGDVIIRVLSSSDKEVEVKNHMKNKYCSTGEIPEKFPYRAKAIFAFEVIDGVEVCFFGLHVQEYGSNCPPPNQRRVYIAYLDSVHFFTPKIVRTQVYHEILLGYLEYVKRLGYTMAHIWACPPSEGDDYIFHCHPPEQKIPKQKRLQEWYKKMLDKGIVERVVTDYKDIYDFYQKEEPLTTVTELPLFEGDFWPNIIEECIREVDAEEAERRREAEAQAAAATSADDGEDDLDEITIPGKKRSAQSSKKHKSKSKSASSKKSKKGNSGTGDDLTDKIMMSLEKHKEVFFVVRLYSKQMAAALPPINDPDQHITCEFMDGRDTFLSTARDRHWEFSSLRRAKYSTMALCYELHTQGQDKFVYTCNTCKNTNAVYHCPECEDFDLCEQCYAKSNHEHKQKMEKIFDPAESGPNQDGTAPNPRDRNESVQRCIQTLVHASQCRDANCRRASCQKMKRVVQHVKTCKNFQSGNGPNSCSVCRQLFSLCLFHARQCQEVNCLVPLCQNIRQKLAAHQAQLRKKREREMMRRINLMSNQNSMPQVAVAAAASAVPGPSTPYQQTASPVPAVNVGASSAMMSQMQYQQQQQQQVNPAAVRAARDIEKIAQQQSQYGMPPTYQQQRPPPQPPPHMAAAMRPPGPMGAQQMNPMMPQQPPPQAPWESGGKPRAAFLQSGQYSGGGGQQPQHQAFGNEETKAIIQNVLQRLKTASSPGEREAIIKSVQNDPHMGPQVFATIIRLARQGPRPQAPPQQQQQPPMWNGPPGQQQQQGPPPQQQQPPPGAMAQQQFFGGGGGGRPPMMNNAQMPPAYGRMPAPQNMYGAATRQAMQQAMSPQQMQQQQHYMQHQQILESGSNAADQNKFL